MKALKVFKNIKKFDIKKTTNSVRKGFHSTKLLVKQHAPIILTITGAVGLVATTVTAVQAGKKVERTVNFLEDKKRAGEEVTRREVVTEVAKDVALPVLLGTASLACFALSYSIQNKRLQAVTAALTIATEEHQRYRLRAKEILDEETFRRLDNPTTTKTVTTIEDGEEVEKEVAIPDEGDFYGRWFLYSEHYASDDPNYNIHHVRDAQEMAHKALMTKGVLLYGELMDLLGFDHDRAHLPFGWTDSDAFYLEWTENMVWSDKLQIEVPELYVRWAIPKNLYGTRQPVLKGRTVVPSVVKDVTPQMIEEPAEVEEE